MSYQIIKGPAIIRGHAVGNALIHTKGDIRINIKTPTLSVGTDYVDNLSQRLQDVIHEISFTPAGTTAEAIAILSTTGMNNKYRGQKLLEPLSVAISAVADAGGGNCTLTIATAKPVYKGQYVWISGSSAGDEAYDGAHLVTADSTGTSVTVAMTWGSDATGTLKIPPCLIIHPILQYAETETIRVYQNAGITSLPALNFSTSGTLLGEMTVSAVYHPYMIPAATNSFVNLMTWAAPASVAFDETTLITTPPQCSFVEAPDTTAPWYNFATLAGMKVALSLGLTPDMTDARGTINWTVTGLTAVATATPVSNVATDEITDATVNTLLDLQSSGALTRGESMHVNEQRALTVTMGNALEFAMPLAVVTAAANGYGTGAPRNGDLQWTAVRTTDAGVPEALFTIA